jgi:hypothetical protein
LEESPLTMLFIEKFFQWHKQGLCTPNALRDRGVLTDNALQREASFTVKEALVLMYHPLRSLGLAKASGVQKLAFALGGTSTQNAFYSEVFPKAQQELRTPNALRGRGILTDNALQRKVSFTIEKAVDYKLIVDTP